jgi:hypothetical protein
MYIERIKTIIKARGRKQNTYSTLLSNGDLKLLLARKPVFIL